MSPKAKPSLTVLPPLDEAEDWRCAQAVAEEVYVRSFERGLGIEGINQELLQELGQDRVAALGRQYAAGLREVVNDLNEHVRKLRAAKL